MLVPRPAPVLTSNVQLPRPFPDLNAEVPDMDTETMKVEEAVEEAAEEAIAGSHLDLGVLPDMVDDDQVAEKDHGDGEEGEDSEDHEVGQDDEEDDEDEDEDDSEDEDEDEDGDGDEDEDEEDEDNAQVLARAKKPSTRSKKILPSKKSIKVHKLDSEVRLVPLIHVGMGYYHRMQILADEGDQSLVGKQDPKQSKKSKRSSRVSGRDRNTEGLHRQSSGAKHVLVDFNYTDLDCRRLAERARTSLRQKIILEDAFPRNIEKLIMEILREVCHTKTEQKFIKRMKREGDERLDDLIDYVSDSESEPPRPSLNLLLLIHPPQVAYCVPHQRNQVKAAAADVVCSAYSLLGHSTAEQIKGKVQWLSQGGHFHYGSANPQVLSLSFDELMDVAEYNPSRRHTMFRPPMDILSLGMSCGSSSS